jgi:Ser/Thr protein kinase RdoA (MazF antagonist)
MEKRITERYSPHILERASSLYSIPTGNIQALDGFESYLYAFERGAEKGILRVSHSIRRSPDLIRGELDWINYLHRGGVSVARPLLSGGGKWVEELDDGQGGFFLAAAFEWAPGETHQELVWSPELLHEYGVQLGRMHHLARTYQPGNPAWKRPEWHDPINLEIDRFLPEEDDQIRKIYHDLKDYLKSLPVNEAGYGMIHQDPHPGNFHVDEGDEITFFDFDDCAYGYFVNDIALVLFYTSLGQEDPATFFPHFLTGFLPGYFQVTSLDSDWFQQIPYFAKLREIDLYALIHRSFDLDDLDPWCTWYMDGRKQRLEQGLPFLEFDPTSFDWEAYS